MLGNSARAATASSAASSAALPVPTLAQLAAAPHRDLREGGEALVVSAAGSTGAATTYRMRFVRGAPAAGVNVPARAPAAHVRPRATRSSMRPPNTAARRVLCNILAP
jgi:hypothetical protein